MRYQRRSWLRVSCGVSGGCGWECELWRQRRSRPGVGPVASAVGAAGSSHVSVGQVAACIGGSGGGRSVGEQRGGPVSSWEREVAQSVAWKGFGRGLVECS